MYGLIGQIKSATGKRDGLISILKRNEEGMAGCHSYKIAKDITDPDMIWITEVWESQQAHQESLQLETVQEAISQARPLISGFGHRFETEPV